jgi:polar amino acid transport system substrate-binding protein
MRLRILTAAVAVLAVAAGCTDNPPAPRATAAATPAATTAPPAAAVDTSCQPRKSLRPTGALPRPGAMPAGSYMAQIQKQGRLRVGTSQDTLLFSSRNPITGKIEGFDVDIARKITQAIFGDPDKIQIIVTTNDKRIPYVTGGTVDIVAKTMTMNCARYKQVDFSSVYYEAGQRVLVSKDSTATGIADLAGKKVCAASGSTSLDNLARLKSPPITVGLPTQADCLVAFQRNQVDAVSTDDTILAGMAAQDPYARIVGERFTEEPYGLAISKDHPEFTRFVNAVLAEQRTGGGWQQTYRTWLGRFGAAPTPPTAQYRD